MSRAEGRAPAFTPGCSPRIAETEIPDRRAQRITHRSTTDLLNSPRSRAESESSNHGFQKLASGKPHAEDSVDPRFLIEDFRTTLISINARDRPLSSERSIAAIKEVEG